MKLTYVLSLIVVLIFFILFFFNKAPRRFYILFVYVFFPFMDLPITSVTWGSLRVIDGISYITFFFLFNEFTFVGKKNRIYLNLFILLISSLFIGSLTSIFISNSLTNILSIFPIFIYSKSLIDECLLDNEFQNKVIWCLKAVAIFSILFLIVQLLVGLDFNFYEKLNRNTLDASGIRYPSFFHDPQKYGQFLTMLSFLFLINDKQIKKPVLKNYILFMGIIIALLTTGARAPVIGLCGGLLLLFLFLGNRYKIVLLIFCVMSIIIIISFHDSLQILQRAETFDSDFQFRSSLWIEALNIYKDNSIFGIGIGNFHNYAMSYSDNYFINSDKAVIFFDQPESGYLMLLTEFGALGFIISFLLILLPIYKSVKINLLKNKDFMIFIIIASILSWLISFVSLYSLSDKRILIVLITLICLLITRSNLGVKNEGIIK